MRGGASASPFSGRGEAMTRCVRILIAAAVVLPLGASAAAGGGGKVPAGPAALSRCLQRGGLAVEPVPRSGYQLRTIHDLAQRRSFVVLDGGRRVAVAVMPSVANAQLLAELLTLPGAPKVQRAGNVVLVPVAKSGTLTKTTGRCLRSVGARASAPPRARPVRRTAATGPPIYTVAGNGVGADSGDGGRAIDAAVDQPRSIAPLPDGSYLVVEPFQEVVRRVWPDGTITRFAGTGVAGYSGDGGPATQAQLNLPHAASLLPSGAVLIADAVNNRIREVRTDGTIITVAGTGSGGFSGDGGPATQAAINAPRGVVALSDGGFLIPDSSNHRVRRVSASGTITTVAGTGVQGFSGDGGPATSATLNTPFGVSPTADGGYLIDDVGNQRVRRVWPDGTITTVAGTGNAGFNGDGIPATSADLYNPHTVWATSNGGFLIADCSNDRVRAVAPDGTISTAVGTGTAGFSGDGGPATGAQIQCPKAVAQLTSGALLVADTSNNRVRYVGAAIAPTSLTAPPSPAAPSRGKRFGPRTAAGRRRRRPPIRTRGSAATPRAAAAPTSRSRPRRRTR